MSNFHPSWRDYFPSGVIRPDGRVQRTGKAKYGNRRAEVDGISFHSAKEAERYRELKLMEAGGLIRGLELQPVFELRAQSSYISTQTVKIGVYKADFRYERFKRPGESQECETVVEDVKGVRTPLYSWKKKHVEIQYGITVVEV